MKIETKMTTETEELRRAVVDTFVDLRRAALAQKLGYERLMFLKGEVLYIAISEYNPIEDTVDTGLSLLAAALRSGNRRSVERCTDLVRHCILSRAPHRLPELAALMATRHAREEQDD